MTVGLEPFKDFLTVVEHRGCWVERKWTVWLHVCTVPALVDGPVNGDHVVSEMLTEARVRKDFFSFCFSTC